MLVVLIDRRRPAINTMILALFWAADGVPRFEHGLLDEYLRFVAARTRPNTVSAQAFDLKVFFTVVAKEPGEVTTADVLGFIEAQRLPRRGGNVVRLADGEAGLAASTIKRRLATISGLFAYLNARGVVAAVSEWLAQVSDVRHCADGHGERCNGVSTLAWAAGVAGIAIGVVLMRFGLLQQDEAADDSDLFARPWWYKVALGALIGLAGASILVKATTGP